MYEHCRAHLRLSEDAAYNRVATARGVRRFPVILDHLAGGWVNVTTVKVLAPVLTAENHLALLAEARHRRKSEVEIIVARVAPRPEVPGKMRKLPARPPLLPQAPAPEASPGASRETEPERTEAETGSGANGSTAETAPKPAPPVRPSAYRPPVKPVAPARFRLDVTVGQEAHDALRFLQDMLAREIPGGDISKVVEHCVLATAAEVRRKTMAAAGKPRAPRPSKDGSRAISAHVRRAVWKRDAERCTFVGRHGQCTQTRYLELHHIHPHALDGPATVENITLRCRAHNVYESEQVFGVRVAAKSDGVGQPAVSGRNAPFQNGGATKGQAP